MSLGRILLSNILLFSLVFGMSATVDTVSLRRQLNNRNALLTGAFLQFVVLPFLGFAVVKTLGVDAPTGLTLLVLTSSPGGTYSNWFCSIFNADLALSVTMTAISTVLSILMLPLNLYIYTTYSYSTSVVRELDWFGLFGSLIVVIGAIIGGLVCSARRRSYKFNRKMNALGSVSGILLILYTLLISTHSNTSTPITLSHRPFTFYIAVALPCILGLLISNLLSSYLRLRKPERVSVAVECCYQNVGIATSVALTMFDGADLTEAVGVPLYYGCVEAVVLGFYCVAAWKCGWTKAPKHEWFWIVLGRSYEVDEMENRGEGEAIEVVLGSKDDGGGEVGRDLIFRRDENARHILDEVTMEALMGSEEKEEVRSSGKDEAYERNLKEKERRKRVVPVTPAGSFPMKLPVSDIV